MKAHAGPQHFRIYLMDSNLLKFYHPLNGIMWPLPAHRLSHFLPSKTARCSKVENWLSALFIISISVLQRLKMWIYTILGIASYVYLSILWSVRLHAGYYFTGDGALRDKDGHYRITGRVDDVINISGHRMGTAEVEDALVRKRMGLFTLFCAVLDKWRCDGMM